VEFHVHIDASSIALGEILAQLGEGNLDNPIYFSRRNPFQAEHIYTTIEREGLTKAYAL
jgi:hypothetical protein